MPSRSSEWITFSRNTNLQQLKHVIEQALATNIITFTEDASIEDEIGHIMSLLIIVKCKRMIIARVLSDGGFALKYVLKYPRLFRRWLILYKGKRNDGESIWQLQM